MELLLKLCAIAGVGAVMVPLLRKTVPEMSVVATVATLLALVFVATGAIGAVVAFIYELSQKAGIREELLRPLVKCVGISIVARLACDICREAGIAAAATYIELVGGAVAVLIVAPLMMTLLGQITS